MKASEARLLALVLLFSTQSMAGMNGSKERAGCAGEFQLWNYTWTATDEHASWDNFHASAAEAGGNIFIVQHGNTSPTFCKSVSDGIVLGNAVDNEWKSVAVKFGGTFDSNKTIFFRQDACTLGGQAPACGGGGGGIIIEACVDGPDPDSGEIGENGDEVQCDDSPPSSPILLDLDRNQFHLSGGPVLFDIDADGQLETITWVAPGTQDAFLFLDRNANGVVDDGSELFGNATLLISGEQAQHGYEALVEFDLVENGGNQDGIIDAADLVFSNLGVWIDSNANGIHEGLESQSLAEANVLSVGVEYRESRRTDSHGNEFRYLGSGSIEVNGKNKKMATTDVFFRRLAQ